MNLPWIPWSPAPFPVQLNNELDRRSGMRNFNYVNASLGNWTDLNTGDWKIYKGPLTPWIRFTSNSIGLEFKSELAPGFIFAAPSDFFSTYGFITSGNDNLGVIGYQPDVNLTPHVIENNLNSPYPINVPSPQIESIEVVIQKELYRKATISWTCFSKKQLEYMTPYFLVPGISCILEWGWNNFNPSSLIDLTNIPQLIKYENNPYPLYTENILNSNGNYDITMGIITNFGWKVSGNKFKCTTEITSKDRIYAGLTINSTVEDLNLTKNGTEIQTGQVKLMNSGLRDFIENGVDLLKSINEKTSAINVSSDNLKLTNSSAAPVTINYFGAQVDVYVHNTNSPATNIIPSPIESSVLSFLTYIKKTRPDSWKEYVYGIFTGRNTSAPKGDTYASNINDDFDIKSPGKHTWINMGLVIDILNYHVSSLGSQVLIDIFIIDNQDVQITGHPNMISTNGGILLIPNMVAPKYFYGDYLKNNVSYSEYSVSSKSSQRTTINEYSSFADIRLNNICLQGGTVYRDDLDELINSNRYHNGIHDDFAFPSINSENFSSGYFNDLYLNVDYLKSLVKDTEIKTYTEFIEKMLSGISSACGNFWDLRLVSSTGNPISDDLPSTMKIIDYKYVPDNIGSPYTFRYMSDNSILTGMEFEPTISNAQAIRTIYANTSTTRNNNRKLNNGCNELLDYKFRDRVFVSDATKQIENPETNPNNDNVLTMLKELQTKDAKDGMYQMTTDRIIINNTVSVKHLSVTDYSSLSVINKLPTLPQSVQYDISGKTYIPPTTEKITRRLAMPSSELLNLLLDDGDYDYNPTYTGIMPGIQASFTLDGIGGLRTFMMFLVDGMPEPYSSDNIIFRITDCKESMSAGKWTTTIVAGVIPLRNGIRKKLGLPPNTKNT